jgi:hypothetical protein
VRTRTVLLLFFTFVATTADPQPIGRRRAVLIGINDYTASLLGRVQSAPPELRDWPNLSGAVNDVSILKDMLIERYGFEPQDVVTLTNQAATRTAILEAIDRHLLQPAAEGDVLFFYYAGHGSQVRNSLSTEPDRLDESFVPADSRLGARDIRDKELRRIFNRILDRGAHLTVILDACHSGSGVRGRSSGVRHRGIRRDERDVVDGANAGPRPEDRGALVLAAAQDYDRAWEIRDDDGRIHGAFSWAWIRAMRDALPNEAAEETFLRAQARVRAETPFQEPVMAGNAEMRRAPFLGMHAGEGNARAVVAVERIRSDGTVVLQGGWANGLAVGNQLRVSGNGQLTITAITGPARSEARLDAGAVRSGQLVAVTGAPGRPWRLLRSRTVSEAPYHLELRRGNELVLRAASASLPPRHYYALAIDRDGRTRLVYPRSGSVENRFPLETPTPEISLGTLTRPADSVFLLSTDEPLPNPWILESALPSDPSMVAAAGWSIERIENFSPKTPQSVAGGV